MQPVYAVSFDVPTPKGRSSEDLFVELKTHVRDWIVRHYDRVGQPIHLDFGSDVELSVAGSDNIAIETLIVPNHEPVSGLWVLRWRHSDNRDKSLAWHIEAKLALSPDLVKFSLLLRISSQVWTVAPVRYELGRPGIVSTIISRYSTLRGPHTLTHRHTLLSATNVGAFVEGLLIAEDRRLPIVLVSPILSQPVVDSSDIASQLCGLAMVYQSEDRETGSQLMQKVGKPLACFDGAVRIYWPGFSLNSRPFDHPLWLADKIEYHQQMGRPFPKFLLSYLSRVSSSRIKQDSYITELEEEYERTKAKETIELYERVRQGDATKDELAKWLQEHETVMQQKDALVKEQDRLLQENEDLKAEVEALRVGFSEVSRNPGFSDPEAASEPVEMETFETVLDAVERAAKQFRAELVFLERAYSSAEASHYNRPDRVFVALKALAEVSRLFRENQLGMPIKVAIEERVSPNCYRPDVSPTAKGKFRQDYEVTYDGRRVLLGPHIGFGHGGGLAPTILRIYLYIDEVKRLFVVGHVGVHLRDDSF